jgi:hypothetical protein
MPRHYEDDRRQSDLYVPDAFRILKKALGNGKYEVAHNYLDNTRAIDLIDRDRELTIAFRVRFDLEHFDEFRRQFTIRFWRQSGNGTEHEKIMSGLVDYALYGWASGSPRLRIFCWVIIDFESYRIHWTKHPELIWKRIKTTKEGTKFYVFNIDKFPKYPPIVFDKS